MMMRSAGSVDITCHLHFRSNIPAGPTPARGPPPRHRTGGGPSRACPARSRVVVLTDEPTTGGGRAGDFRRFGVLCLQSWRGAAVRGRRERPDKEVAEMMRNRGRRCAGRRMTVAAALSVGLLVP